MKNNRENDRDLITALELDGVLQVVDEKLQAVYAQLPDTVPTGKKRGMKKIVKRILTAVSAVAAGFVILLFGTAVNPALAENIPFFGDLFVSIANRGGWNNSKQTLMNLEKYAQRLEGVSVHVPAAGRDESPLTLSAEEYYYDGTFLYVALSVQVRSGVRSLHFRTFTPGGYNLLIDGEELGRYDEEQGVAWEEGSFELDRCYLVNIGGGRYVGKRAQVLPERFRDREELSVTLRFLGLYGRNSLEGTFNSSPIELNFTVQKNDAPVLRFDGNGLEMGGVVLGSGVATPGGVCFTIERPAAYKDPFSGISFENGGIIGSVSYAGAERELGNGMVQKTLICGGYAEDERRRLIVSLFDPIGTGEYVAVFRVDPRAGTAELGSADDVEPLISRVFRASPEDIVNSEAQHMITLASHRVGGSELSVQVATQDRLPQTDMLIEAWQDGACLSSRFYERAGNGGDSFYSGNKYSYEEEKDGEIYLQIVYRNQYSFSLLGMEEFDPDHPVTVKLYGKDGGLQMEETVRLLNSEAYERLSPKSSESFTGND